MTPVPSGSAVTRIAGQILFGVALLAGASALLSALDRDRNAVARRAAGVPPEGVFETGGAGLSASRRRPDLAAGGSAYRRQARYAARLYLDLSCRGCSDRFGSTFIPPYQATGLFLGVLVGRHEEGVAILKKGIRHNPDNWQLPFLAGYISYYERCDPAAVGNCFDRGASARCAFVSSAIGRTYDGGERGRFRGA